MPTVLVATSNNRAYLPDNNGDDITAERTAPNQPFVTPNGSPTSQDRHVVARSTGAAVFARSSGKEVFTRGSPNSRRS